MSSTIKLPLPAAHWLMEEGVSDPPMPWRVGEGMLRDAMADDIRLAARYAIRAATMNGKDLDFDPDAMVQNFVVGMIGYWTTTGLSEL